MNVKSFLSSFAPIFVIVFIVTVIVTYLYTLVAHGYGVVDWDSAFRFGLIFGVSLPLVARFERKK